LGLGYFTGTKNISSISSSTLSDTISPSNNANTLPSFPLNTTSVPNLNTNQNNQNIVPINPPNTGILINNGNTNQNIIPIGPANTLCKKYTKAEYNKALAAQANMLSLEKQIGVYNPDPVLYNPDPALYINEKSTLIRNKKIYNKYIDDIYAYIKKNCGGSCDDNFMIVQQKEINKTKDLIKPIDKKLSLISQFEALQKQNPNMQKIIIC